MFEVMLPVQQFVVVACRLQQIGDLIWGGEAERGLRNEASCSQVLYEGNYLGFRMGLVPGVLEVKRFWFRCLGFRVCTRIGGPIPITQAPVLCLTIFRPHGIQPKQTELTLGWRVGICGSGFGLYGSGLLCPRRHVRSDCNLEKQPSRIHSLPCAPDVLNPEP